MATRSIIGLLNEKTNKVSYIYSHWDGYPDGVGTTLCRSYTDLTKIKSLINLGDISSLSENVSPPVGVVHTFNKPYSGVTVAYRRDRGEKSVSTKKKTTDRDSFIDVGDNHGAEYVYLFVPSKNEWEVTRV